MRSTTEMIYAIEVKENEGMLLVFIKSNIMVTELRHVGYQQHKN